jgi:hypothetical protein
LKNADMALAKYLDTHSFMDTARALNSMMEGVDLECEKASRVLAVTTMVDTALLMLTGFALVEMGREGYTAVTKLAAQIAATGFEAQTGTTVVCSKIVSRLHYCLGVAELGLNHPVKAGKAFARSYKLLSNNSARDGHKTATLWDNLGKQARKTHLGTLLDSLPTKPLEILDMKSYTTPEVASEHWVMRELGLEGPIPYADKIKPAMSIILVDTPHPSHHNQGPHTAHVGEVKPEVLRKHAEKYRKVMNQPPANGRLISWVGLSANQIGEETILNEADYVQSMRGMGRGGCNAQ